MNIFLYYLSIQYVYISIYLSKYLTIFLPMYLSTLFILFWGICSIVNLSLLYSDNTGFLEAAINGHLNILEFLLTKGASVDQKNISGKIQKDEGDRYGKIQLLFIYLSMIPLWLKLFTAFIYLSIHLSSYRLIIYKFIYLSIHLFLYLSIYLIFCVCIQYNIIVFR